MSNLFCKKFEIDKPIIQGPMAWVSTAPLVAAVAEAGGLGVLGVALGDEKFTYDQIRQVKELTDKRFAINTALWPDEDKMDKFLEYVQREEISIVHIDCLENVDKSYAKKYFDILRSWDVKIIAKVATIADAVTVEKAGADAIIPKGWDGGGHVSLETTMVLVPQAADVLKKSILIASGGIADGRGMAAAIALGAEAVEMGSAFMIALETEIHHNAKQAILEAKDHSTTITGISNDSTCRQLINKLSDRVLEIERTNSKDKAAEMTLPMLQNSLKVAMFHGDIEEEGSVMVGQIVGMLNKERTVKEIIDETIEECKKVTSSISNYKFGL